MEECRVYIVAGNHRSRESLRLSNGGGFNAPHFDDLLPLWLTEADDDLVEETRVGGFLDGVSRSVFLPVHWLQNRQFVVVEKDFGQSCLE